MTVSPVKQAPIARCYLESTLKPLALVSGNTSNALLQGSDRSPIASLVTLAPSSRELSTNLHFCPNKEQVAVVPKSTFCKKHGIVDVVRLRSNEIQRLQAGEFKKGDSFTHFNLGGTNNRPGEYYGMLMIEEPGYKKEINGDVEEKKPLLAPFLYKVLCISAQSEVSYGNFPMDALKNPLDNKLKGQDEKKLSTVIIEKHQGSTGLSDKEIKSKGVAITHFSLANQDQVSVTYDNEQLKDKAVLVTK